jgi:hypothetical protein
MALRNQLMKAFGEKHRKYESVNEQQKRMKKIMSCICSSYQNIGGYQHQRNNVKIISENIMK